MKDARLVVGRDKEENAILQSCARPEDIVLKLKDHEGPISIFRGKINEDLLNLAASIAAYHTKYRNENFLRVDYWAGNKEGRKTVSVKPAAPADIEKRRI